MQDLLASIKICGDEEAVRVEEETDEEDEDFDGSEEEEDSDDEVLIPSLASRPFEVKCCALGSITSRDPSK